MMMLLKEVWMWACPEASTTTFFFFLTFFAIVDVFEVISPQRKLPSA
jgi:hypothetical protein